MLFSYLSISKSLRQLWFYGFFQCKNWSWEFSRDFHNCTRATILVLINQVLSNQKFNKAFCDWEHFDFWLLASTTTKKVRWVWKKSWEIGVAQVANVFNFIRDKDIFDGNSQVAVFLRNFELRMKYGARVLRTRAAFQPHSESFSTLYSSKGLKPAFFFVNVWILFKRQ